MSLSNRSLVCSAVGAFALCAACGGDDDPNPPAEGPYVVSTIVFTPDGANSLVGLVEDPAVAATLDTNFGQAFAGAAAVYGRDGQRSFVLGTDESPMLTRYDVVDGAFVEGARMSLMTAGISSGFKRQGLAPVLSETKAYWLDDASQQVVVWNPETMTLTRTFSLAAAGQPNTVLELGENSVLRGNLLIIGARRRTADMGETGRAIALVIDTATDALVDVVEDDRCGDSIHVVQDSSGAIYFGSGALGASLFALHRPATYPAPCLLRMLPDEQRFDPDFHVALPGLVANHAAGRLVQGKSGQAFVLALHEEELSKPITPDTDLFGPYGESAWHWWQIDLDSDQPGTLVSAVAASSAAGRSLIAGGQEYITSVHDATASRTTLLVANPGGSLDAGLELPGVPFALMRLR